jgi:hypothetical protein
LKYPKYNYQAIALDGLKRKRDVLTIDQLLKLQLYGKKEIFTTWCRFPEGYYTYWTDNNKSVASYNGDCYADYLPIDIDNKDQGEALKTCMDLLGVLDSTYQVPLDSLRIYCSGSKGFHVEIPIALFGEVSPSKNLPVITRYIAESLGIEIDTTIYHRNGLWRFPNTKNLKSGLYKIPLSPSEIVNLSIEEIKKIAEVPRKFENEIPLDEWNPILKDVWDQATLAQNKIIKITNKTEYRRQWNFPGVDKTERNVAAFEIARTMKSNGETINTVQDYIVNAWNPTNKPPETDEKTLRRTVFSVFGYSFQDKSTIDIFRFLRENPYYHSLKAEQQAIFIHFLYTANEKEKKVWNKYTCKPGQRIFSYMSVAQSVGVTERQVRTAVDKLVGWGMADPPEVLKNENGKIECSRLTLNFYKKEMLE